MEVTDDIYTIALHPGETQYDLYENITEVVDEFATNDQLFIARLSEAQAITLRNDSRVSGVDNMMEAAELMEDDGDKSKVVVVPDQLGSDHCPIVLELEIKK